MIYLIFWLHFLCGSISHAFEMTGLVNYDISQITPKPSNYISSNQGIGYSFFGRLDLGPGQIESGFLYTPVGVTTQVANQNITISGSYWILPVLYRFVFLPPFLSLAAGFDYALVGNSAIVSSDLLNPSSGYKSHFGYEVGIEAVQDVGENLGAVLDVRYRAGIGNAISLPSESSPVQNSVKYDFLIIGLGIQKRLD